MSLTNKDLLECVNILAKQEGWVVSLKTSLTMGVLAGAGTVVGGVLAFPLKCTTAGSLIGGLIGTTVGYLSQREKHLSLIDIINAMEEREKEKFMAHLKNILEKFDCVEAVTFVKLTLPPEVKEEIASQILSLVRETFLNQYVVLSAG